MFFKYILLALVIQNLYSVNIVLDIGHTPKQPGATSSNCEKEYKYNKELALYIFEQLKNNNNIEISLSSKYEDQELTFKDRYDSSINKDLFISVHHDSVQKQFINYINKCPTTNYAEGFSIFVSKKNIQYEKSLEYAKIFAEELISKGLVPTLHHSEKIKGENRELLDKKLGIYLFDDLKVLKNANSPAFLFEAGVVVNPNEEKKVKTKDFKDNITEAFMKLLN
ncbi:N-acetylmuramoyl-L-alanine amidase [Aliarcobacter cryaerophilus]|uniref:N-acetylmuramoyl-L-alanine amidase n=1 Tax=Arcobacter sp. AZ-2023 TaxID=3074453 RepID=A0AA96IH26_9BACT|nr:N-acetylmuramoyl-L-alanine amidase [Arcobacter sp. AZ-2023]